MPKKIKKEKDTVLKPHKESVINVDNIHYFFIALAVIILCICIGVGVYVYREDKYHEHKDNAVVDFVYTEALDEGYDVFSVTETDTKQVFTEHNSLEVQDVNEISRGKYLDFNEEVYNSGLLEYMSDDEAITTDDKWSLYIEFADGTKKYLYSSALGQEETQIDKSSLVEIIQKYFNVEILYK